MAAEQLSRMILEDQQFNRAAVYAALVAFLELDPEQQQETLKKVRALLETVKWRLQPAVLVYWYAILRLFESIEALDNPGVRKLLSQSLVRTREAKGGARSSADPDLSGLQERLRLAVIKARSGLLL